MSIQATWKLVEGILNTERPSPETDARLLEHIKRLVAEREGLAVLADHVRQYGPWRPGSMFLDLLSQGMTGARDAGIATKHGEAFEGLAVTIIKATDLDDRSHQAILSILYRLNGKGYLDAVQRDLIQLWERDLQCDPLAVVHRVLGLSMPQQDWHGTLKRLHETTESRALKAKLWEAIQHLGRDRDRGPAGLGPDPTLPMKTPPRSPDVPSEKPPLNPLPRADRDKSVHEEPTGASRVIKYPASTLSDSEPQSASDEAKGDRVKRMAPAPAESELHPEGPTSSLARAGQPAADSVARPIGPIGPGDRGEVFSPEVAVTAKSPGEEAVTIGSPGTEELPLQVSTKATDSPRQVITGDKGSPDPGGVSGPSPEPLSESRSDAKVTEQPGPPVIDLATTDQAPNPVLEPTTEPSPPRVKSSKTKRPPKSVAPPAASVAATTGPVASLANLEAYLAEVTQKITGLFRDRDGDRQDLLSRCALAERENQQLRAKLTEAIRNAEAIASALEEARATSAEQVARISALESRLSIGQEATRTAEERAKQLDKDLEDAFLEIEETERRAGDKVHRAEKEKELGVKTFRFELRRRIEPYLSEVLDDARDPSELNPEQDRLHQRLRKILVVLRETGVMGE